MGFDKETQRADYLSVQKLSQEYQGLLTKINPSMLPTEILQLDNMHVVQAVGEDLRKKLLRHLITTQALTIGKNVQQFSAIILLAIEKEDELKTIMNIVEGTAFQGQRDTAIGG